MKIQIPEPQPRYDWARLVPLGITPSLSQLCDRKPRMVIIPREIWEPALALLGSEEAVARWLWTENEELDGVTPYRMLEAKRSKALLEYLEAKKEKQNDRGEDMKQGTGNGSPLQQR